VEEPSWTGIFPTFALSAGPEESSFAALAAPSRCWPTEGTVVALQHLITTRDFSVLLPRAAKSELEDLLFQSKNDRLLFAYFGTTIPISLTRCL